ncbi:precorrin-3B synthase [Nitratireductor aquibiodomus]|uniref:precorrin-3B synthase n=1 Tax=Nitratireductor aquibiodomus TaxID=204799 RepID=UPI0019D40559|nr:precorrin-3B synthase [Nitratireductor aquibiodomus]MBN7760825.1 precorrin-3B synthase [Nitratireductor aquibiodomus]
MTMRRGACPTLSAPMKTGDGLLARIAPAHGALTPEKLAGIARAARRHGNGILEVTARGKLQIRGLTAESAPLICAEINALDLGAVDGFAVETGPLDGLARDALSDPTALARRIDEYAAAHCLAPKVSVTVDGGGTLHLDAIGADIKLVALGDGLWQLGVGGNGATAGWLGHGDEQAVGAAALAVLDLLAQTGGRARDFTQAQKDALRAGLEPAVQYFARADSAPVGLFALKDGDSALGIALPFGQVAAEALVALCEAASDAREIRLAPRSGLLLIGLDEPRQEALSRAAEALGFVTDGYDPRLSIAACAGAPACASARFDAKALAAEAAEAGLPDGSFRLHLSACEKGCAQPAGAAVNLIAAEGCCTLSSIGAEPSERLRTFLIERGEKLRAALLRKTG